MKTIGKMIDNLNEFLGKIISYLGFVLFLVVLFNVFARYLFRSPLIWANEVNKYLLGIMFFIGGGYHVLKRDYITVDFIYEKLPKKMQLICMIISYLAVVVGCFCIFYFGLGYAIKSIVRREISIEVWRKPIYIH